MSEVPLYSSPVRVSDSAQRIRWAWSLHAVHVVLQYPWRGEGVMFDPPQVLGSDVSLTVVTRNLGHAPPLGWSFAPRHSPTVGP